MLKSKQILIFPTIFLSVMLSSAFADDTNKTGAYEDKNGYFAFNPPKGWKMQESFEGYRSKVTFISPDDAAMLMVLAELDDYDLQDLFSLKKDWVKERKELYPDGIFEAKWSAICGFDAVEVDFDIPGKMKKEMYFFYFDGARYDLTYSVAKAEDFEKYRNAAFGSFSSLKAKSRVLKTY